MINPNWLSTFCTLVEQQHFTATAKKLFMTQSGVSQHIQKLEQHLDTPLLIREGKSFSLTDAGDKLYQKAGRLLQAFSDLELEVKQDTPYQGKVKIASPGSVGLRLYPFLLSQQQQHRKLAIEYAFAPNKNIEQQLLSREIDLGLITELPRSNKLECIKIADEPLVLVTPANLTSVDWPTLLALGFVSHPDAAHHGQLLLQRNFTQFEHVEQFEGKGYSNQIGLILDPVSLGLGFTVLPLHAARAFHRQEQILIHQLEQQVCEPLYLCFNRSSQIPARIQFIKQQITEFVGLT